MREATRAFLNHIREQCSLSDLARVPDDIDKHGFPQLKKDIGFKDSVSIRIAVHVERVEPERSYQFPLLGVSPFGSV